jgi:hypothetical protein
MATSGLSPLEQILASDWNPQRGQAAAAGIEARRGTANPPSLLENALAGIYRGIRPTQNNLGGLVAAIKPVDALFWRLEPNAAGGVPTPLLTQPGREVAFRVGTGHAVTGPLLDKLEMLYAGSQKVDAPGMGDVPLMHPWIQRDGDWLSLSSEGRKMVERGIAEQSRLLDRVKSNIPMSEGGKQ